MIQRVEAKGFRALRHVDVNLKLFQLLAGPNASGKSTFFDTIHLLRDTLNVGLEHAVLGDLSAGVDQRADDPTDLTWMREGKPIEIALTARLPETLRERVDFSFCRYEVEIAADPSLALANETFWLCREYPEADKRPVQPDLPSFPSPLPEGTPVVRSSGKKAPNGWKSVVHKIANKGNDYFRSETTGWNSLFRLGPAKSALANLPEDEERFPAAIWFKRLLMEGIHRLALNAESMRLPCPPGGAKDFLPDGSNMPWAVWDLEQHDPDSLQEWVEHLGTALPDLEAVYTREREENRSRYVVLRYRSGLEAPSWVVSDGTLRLLALTLLAYTREHPGLLLIEEPENGIHPRAVESVMHSLSSIRGAQVLCATHSPVALSLAKPQEILCFGKTDAGEADIRSGEDHPRLRDWQGGIALGDLFAAGVLS